MLCTSGGGGQTRTTTEFQLVLALCHPKNDILHSLFTIHESLERRVRGKYKGLVITLTGLKGRCKDAKL